MFDHFDSVMLSNNILPDTIAEESESLVIAQLWESMTTPGVITFSNSKVEKGTSEQILANAAKNCNQDHS